LTIIGGGGISTGKNVRNASQAGANFITVGSGLTGMSTAQVIEYFSALFDDMENGTDFAERFLEKTAHNVQSNMTYRKFEVAEKTALADDLFLLRFNQSLTNFGPGQFVFVWIPGKGERPFSTFTASPLSLLVGIKGECTRFMSQLKAGDCVYIRGPYGNIPKVRGRILLVGGGTGVAGLYQFAEDFGPNSVAVLGAKDRAHLYDAPFRLCCKVYFSTETDSDAKHRGLVTDHLEKIIWREQPDYCLNCGPLGMVKKALEIEGPFFPEDCILSSLEFHTDCGVGICGKDATPSGFRPCVDGTFLTKTQLGL
jgi:dihydroorotate dehydrogenase (NAD+) catalytic subunit